MKNDFAVVIINMGYDNWECVFCRTCEESSLDLCPFCLITIFKLVKDKHNANITYVTWCMQRTTVDGHDLFGSDCDLCDTKGFSVCLPCCGECMSEKSLSA